MNFFKKKKPKTETRKKHKKLLKNTHTHTLMIKNGWKTISSKT